MRLLTRIAVDTTPLRESRDLRLLLLGNVVTGLGTQATLVALPYQLYVETHSAFLVGLLGAAELIPLVTLALLGGALADRYDRRRLLLLDQIALVALAAALAALAFAGSPPVGLLYLLGGLLAGFAALQNVTRSSIVPNLVAPARLPSALALSFGLFQLTLVIGPAIAGVLIGAVGLGWAYSLDALSCLAFVGAIVQMSPQPPHTTAGPRAALRSSIGEGLRYVRSNQALMGNAQQRWQNSVSALQDALRIQAGVVGNLDTNRTQMSALVTSSQSATGALQATQAGNQMLALQAQQLADLTAAIAAQGRAQSLQAAQQAAAQDQAKEQLRRFLTPGTGYQPTTITMFR